MKLVVHQAKLSRRRKVGGALVALGLVLLITGLVNGYFFTSRPTLDYALLVAGTVCAWLGMSQVDRWLTPPRPEIALPAALGDAGPPWALYYQALPAELVLVTPGGLVLIDDFKHDGLARIEGERWRDQRPLFRKLSSLGRRALRNPERFLDLQRDELREALVARDASWEELPIDRIAVFTSPAAELDREEPSIPVLRADELRTWLRTEGRQKALKPMVQRELARTLDEMAAERIDGREADEAADGADQDASEGEAAESA